MNRQSFAGVLAHVDSMCPQERVRTRVRAAGIRSVRDLARKAETSRGDLAALCCWLLGKFEGQQAEDALLRILRGRRRSLWMQAAAGLATARRSRTAHALMGIVVQDSAPVRREGSVYALGFMDAKGREAELVDTLLLALEKDPVAHVRAQAAESLANRLRFTRIKGGSRARGALIKHLTDTSADVRFWCAYAVGELRLKAAVSSLRRLTRDRASVSGWWSVGTEARDALKVIAGGDWPDRRRRR